MSDSSSSTLKAYADSALATGQSALGKLTGSAEDQARAQSTHSKAESEHAASHSVAQLGPVSATPSGGTSIADPARSEGSWNQTIGAGKEAVGNLIGAEGLKKEGVRQNEEGKAQEAEGQVRDLGQGVQDRVRGTVGGVVSAVTGDREGEERWREVHDGGKAAQRSVEADLQRKGGE